MANFISKTANFITGSGDIAASIASLKRSTAGLTSRARAAAIPRRQKQKRLPTDSKDPAERFAVAVRVHGVGDDALRAIKTRSAKSFGLCLNLAIVSLLLCCGLLWFQRGLGALDAAALTALMLCLCVQHGHTNWQIRTRRLGSVSSYIRDSRAWFPDYDGGRP